LHSVSLFFLFLFVFYWTWGSYEHFFGWLFNSDSYHVRYVSTVGISYWSAHIGLTLRLTGVICGLISLFSLCLNVKFPFRIKLLVAAALILEGIYYLLYIPWVPYLWRPDTYILSVSYLLQVLLTSPFLIFLAIKMKTYQSGGENRRFWKWAGLTFTCYMLSLWVNALFRWFDMVRIEGFQLLFTGIIPLGFLNGAITMSLAVVFSFAAARSILEMDQASSKRWIGLALIMLGIHYVIYFIYSQLAGLMNFILLVDVWTIPLLALGTTLLYESRERSIQIDFNS